MKTVAMLVLAGAAWACDAAAAQDKPDGALTSITVKIDDV